MIVLYDVRCWEYSYEQSSAYSGRFQKLAGDIDKKAMMAVRMLVDRSTEVGSLEMLSAVPQTFIQSLLSGGPHPGHGSQVVERSSECAF